MQLTLVAVLVGAPQGTFVGDHWTTPEPRDLLALDQLISAPAPAKPDEPPIARALTVARAETPRPTAPPPPAASRALPTSPATPAAAAAPSGGSWVNASWYGPGFYGNRTACGQTFTAASWGIAHKTLRCGTMVQITYRGRTVSAPVIDRGPYIAGREVDLAAAVAGALGFTGVQPIYLVIP